VIPHDAGLPDPSSNLPPPQRDHYPPVAGRIEPGIPVGRAPEAPTPPGLSATPDLFSLLQALRRRWIAAVLLGGTLAVVAGVTTWVLMTPKETAFAKLRVAASPDPIAYGKEGASSNDSHVYMQTAAAQILTRPVINAALQREEVKRLNLQALDADPVAFVEEYLKVEFKEPSEILTVTLSNSDPAVALALVNAVTESYLETVVYAERNARAAKVTKLDKAINDANEALGAKRARLTNLARGNRVVDPVRWERERMELLTSLRDARGQLSQVSFRLVEAQANLEAFDARAASLRDRPPGTGPDLDDALDRDQAASKLQERITHWEELIEDYRRKGIVNDPDVIAARSRLQVLRKQFTARRTKLAARLKKAAAGMGAGHEDPAIVRKGLEKTVEHLSDLKKSLEADVKDLTAQAAKPLPPGQDEFLALQEEIRSDERVVDDLRSKHKREDIELQAAGRITQVHGAELMKKDIKKQLLATAVAPVAVLFGSCMGLAWLDFRQRRIRSAGQVSRGLGIRVVGAVPDLPNLERQLVGPSGEPVLEGHPVLESIDALRTQLLHEADRPGRGGLVMVTSATAGEGKTTLASHLAGSLARAGRKTLLLDGDLRRPSVHELFEVPMQPGFSEILLGEVEVADAVQEKLENLSIIPAGQWDREVLLALARGGLEGIFEKLAEEFDFIIIDSHPVLAATDSLLIGRQVDAVILSVLREVSQMPKVYSAAQRLTGLGIRVLGAVVSGTDPEEVVTAPAAAASAA
jgi:capsular exopolysaccharide synthesis family protein